MTREQIIHNLFTGENFNDCISKMEPNHLQDDLRQEVILIVCEMPGQKLIEIYERGMLVNYVARLIVYQTTNPKNQFQKKFRQVSQELTGQEIADDRQDEERVVKEWIEELALAEIEAMKDHKEHWYAYELIQLYKKHNNFRAIEKETRIPFISCYKTIKKTMDDIKVKVDYIKANPIKCNRIK